MLTVDAKKGIKARRVQDLEEMVSRCDVVTVVSRLQLSALTRKNCPLHEKTKGLFNKELIGKMKGSWLVNTARGAICDAQAVAEALESGHLSGYSGDVWNKSLRLSYDEKLMRIHVQPAPLDHPWRKMRNPLGTLSSPIGNPIADVVQEAETEWSRIVLTSHCLWSGLIALDSGTTLDAQKRYADGTKDIIRRYFAGEEQNPVNLIVVNGQYASKAYGERQPKATGQRTGKTGP